MNESFEIDVLMLTLSSVMHLWDNYGVT